MPSLILNNFLINLELVGNFTLELPAILNLNTRYKTRVSMSSSESINEISNKETSDLEDKWRKLWDVLKTNDEKREFNILQAVYDFRFALENYLEISGNAGSQEDLFKIISPLMTKVQISRENFKNILIELDKINLGLGDYSRNKNYRDQFIGEHNIIADKYFKIASTLNIVTALIAEKLKSLKEETTRVNDYATKEEKLKYLGHAEDLFKHLSRSLNSAKESVSLLQKAYLDLHPSRGEKNDAVANLVGRCKKANSVEDLLIELMKDYNLRLQEIKKKNPKDFVDNTDFIFSSRNAKEKENDQYITFLNSEKSKHQFDRLLVFLLIHLTKNLDKDLKERCGITDEFVSALNTINIPPKEKFSQKLLGRKSAAEVYATFMTKLSDQPVTKELRHSPQGGLVS